MNYETKAARAEAIAAALDGRVVSGERLSARVWVGAEKVRVYLTRAGKAVGYVAQAPTTGAVTVLESRLMSDHGDVVAAAESACAGLEVAS